MEVDFMRELQMAASESGHRLFRNNVGSARAADGRYLTYGLCKGSGDLIGWKRITITPDMVGKTVAVFWSVEVKGKKGVESREQAIWRDVVDRAGGISEVRREGI